MTIDQAMELLELEPPASLRQIQLARRKLAKRWHPDRAAPDQRNVHERQMKSVNQAADLLELRVEADGPITKCAHTPGSSCSSTSGTSARKVS